MGEQIETISKGLYEKDEYVSIRNKSFDVVFLTDDTQENTKIEETDTPYGKTLTKCYNININNFENIPKNKGIVIFTKDKNICNKIFNIIKDKYKNNEIPFVVKEGLLYKRFNSHNYYYSEGKFDGDAIKISLSLIHRYYMKLDG